MGAAISEFVPPRAVELFTEPLPANDGLCWPVCEVGVGGMPHETGATPKRGHFIWGESGRAPADAVFVKVTDLGGLQEDGQDAFLWACLYDGRLFLHIGAAAPGAGSGTLPEAGEGFVAGSDAAGMLDGNGTGRHSGPDAYVCAMDERDAYLKTTNKATGASKWRADLAWDILATAYFRTSNVYTRFNEYPSKVLTVWVVSAGNVLCFYTTTADFHTAAGGAVYRPRNWAAFGSVTLHYGYDPEDEFDVGSGYASTGQPTFGNVAPVVWGAYADLQPFMAVAPLPWQGEAGDDAVFPADEVAEMNCGTMNVVCAEEGTGLPFGDTSFQPDPGLYFCPRLHFVNGRSAYSGGAQFTPGNVATILYGQGSDFPAFELDPEHYYLGTLGSQGVHLCVVPGFNLLFDPWAVECLGLFKRDTMDFARVDAHDYLPPAPGAEWVRVAAATLTGPVGPVYLDIAGADADGCLLTASGSTECFD